MKKNIYLSLAGLGTLLGLIAVALYIFLPGLMINDTALQGYETIFGYTASESWGPFSVSAEVLTFSTPLFLVLMMTVVAIVLVLLSTLLPSKLVNFLVSIMFIVSAVFVFITPSMVVITDEAMNFISRDDLSLPAEATISGVLFIIAALTSGAGLTSKK